MPKSLVSLIGIVFFLLVSTGCARTPPSTFYTLSPMASSPAEMESDNSEVAVLLGPLTLPEFLDRPQIVTRSKVNVLDLSEFHRWGGSLDSDFLRIVRENLSLMLYSNRILSFQPRRLFPIDYAVTLDVYRFDGELGGDVVLNANWIVSDQRKAESVMVRNSVIRQPTESSGHDAFVAAQSIALEKLSREIADAILRMSDK